MKPSIFYLLAIALLFVFGCKSSKKVTIVDTDSKSVVVEAPVETVDAETEKQRAMETEGIEYASDLKIEELTNEWTGEELIEETANRLIIHLSTENHISEKIKSLLTDQFLIQGGELKGTYPVGDAREFGNKIINNSSEPILEIIDDHQKELFQMYLEN